VNGLRGAAELIDAICQELFGQMIEVLGATG
jgi:hypothetical protein